MSRGLRTVGRYPRSLRILHWTIALGVLVQVALGWTAELSDDRAASRELMQFHYWLGMSLLALMTLRLGRRLSPGVPPPEPGPRPLQRTAIFVHVSLYLLLFLLPLSGYAIRTWPPYEEAFWPVVAWYIHYWSGWALLALVALHVLAALWHQLVRRDGLIGRRML